MEFLAIIIILNMQINIKSYKQYCTYHQYTPLTINSRTLQSVT